jgi:hypothetical protein
MTDEHTIVYKGQFSVLHLMKSAYNLNLYKRATVHKGCIFRLPSVPFIYRFDCISKNFIEILQFIRVKVDF